MANADRMRVEIVRDGVITISKEEYDELSLKATHYDDIRRSIRRAIDKGRFYGPVDDDLVLMMTGMDTYLDLKEREQKEKLKAGKEAAMQMEMQANE